MRLIYSHHTPQPSPTARQNLESSSTVGSFPRFTAVWQYTTHPALDALRFRRGRCGVCRDNRSRCSQSSGNYFQQGAPRHGRMTASSCGVEESTAVGAAMGLLLSSQT